MFKIIKTHLIDFGKKIYIIYYFFKEKISRKLHNFYFKEASRLKQLMSHSVR